MAHACGQYFDFVPDNSRLNTCMGTINYQIDRSMDASTLLNHSIKLIGHMRRHTTAIHRMRSYNLWDPVKFDSNNILWLNPLIDQSLSASH